MVIRPANGDERAIRLWQRFDFVVVGCLRGRSNIRGSAMWMRS